MKKSHLRIVLRLLLLSLIVCVVITPCVLAANNNAGKGSTSNDKLVLTPGGYRPESKVHEIKPGESLRVANGHLQKVGPKGTVLEDYGEVKGTRTVPSGNKPLAEGWVSYASWTRPAGTLIDSFTTTWTVPPAPATDHGQTIFLFNGIQNAGFIFQPVLQWGPSAAGGGSYWTITNWYVDGPGGDAFWTAPLLTVNTGDILTGVMARTGVGTTQGNYDYISQFQGIPAQDLVMANIPELYWFIETLEVYDIQACTDYPAGFTGFSNIEIRDSTGGHPAIQWTANNAATDCGQHTCIISNANPGGIVDIHYSDEAPTANAGGPYSAPEGTPIQFDGTGSGSPDGDALTYAWNFGDGSSGTGATPTHTYCDNGVYTVTLTVTECGGKSATATTTATVANVPPVAVAKPDTQTVGEGMEAWFDGSGSYDPGCDTLSYHWDFGDGVHYADVPTTTFTFCDIGDHEVKLTVSDDDGGISTDTVTVIVNNVPPVAEAGDDQTVNEGDTVSFSGSATSYAGFCDTLTYEWDFGDGSAAVTDTLTPTHVYCDNGDYTVTLTVTDDEGTTVSDTLLVTVNNVAPTVTKGAMDQPNPEFILPLQTLTFHGTFSNPGWCDTHTALWSFGDGQTSVGTLTEENLQPDATGTVTATHAYGAPGDYVVTVTVTDDDGNAGSAEWNVHVADVAEAKHILAAYIQGLPANAFKGQADQRKAAFANKFSALDDMITDEEWNGFITSLQSDIRDKADGHVDGKPNDDWITSKVAQQEICMKIDDIVAYVETLL